MKNIFIITLLIICGALPAKAQVNFANANNVVDLGQVQKGDSIMYQFEFTNTGSGDIRIKSVKSDNPSLKFLWPDKDIKPGKKDAITAMCHPLEGNDVGSFNSDIRAEWTGTSNGVAILRVKGAVVPSRADPLPKSFDTSTSIKIPLSRRDRKPFKN